MKKLLQIAAIATYLCVVTLHEVDARVAAICNGFSQLPREDIHRLSGLIYYLDKGNSGSDFSIIDGETLRSIQFPMREKGYITHSPGGEWILTSDWDPAKPDVYELWLHSTDLKQNRFLLLESSGAAGWYWLDEHRVMKVWSSWDGAREGKREGEIIDISSSPPEISIPPFIARINSKGLTWFGYDPISNTLLVRQPIRSEIYTGGVYSAYDIATDTVSALPHGPLDLLQPITGADWSTDGRLAYAMSIALDPAVESAYDELVIRRFPGNVSEQVSDFKHQIGPVRFMFTNDIFWSPDNERLAFQMTTLQKPGDADDTDRLNRLYTYNPETRELTSLCVKPEGAGYFPYFFWSPDSEYIAFMQNHNLYVVNVETTAVSLIRSDVSDLYGWGPKAG